jgi:hypothetical protein
LDHEEVQYYLSYVQVSGKHRGVVGLVWVGGGWETKGKVLEVKEVPRLYEWEENKKGSCNTFISYLW